MDQPFKVLMLGESLDRQGGIVSVEKLILQHHASDIQFEHVATLVQGSGVHKILGYGSAVVRVFWQLLLQKPDLLHVHVSERGSAFRQALTSLMATIFAKPVILHTHGSEFHLFYASLPPWVRTGLSRIFRQCDRVIVLSETWRSFYINELGLAGDRVIVLANPVKVPDQIPERSTLPRDKIRLICLGRIGQRKGAFDLINAFARMPSEIQDQAELILAGDGAVEEAKTLITELGLKKTIMVKNWLNSDQRDALLGQADIFILPSHNEGLPMALLEAMSWGLPPIVTPVGGIPEVVTSNQNGLLVQPGNLDQISAAMHSLITNTDLRLLLGLNARKTALLFDIENYMCSLHKIYWNVLL
jgi:glycosyltransferase involved in cell wall biosynthesis